MAAVANEKGVFMIVPGGHTDAVTGTTCHWNVFRICNPTQTEANAVAGTLIKAYGKKWYYITPDYAFGHTLEAGMIKAAATLGGTDRRRSYAAWHHRLLLLLDQGSGAKPDVIIFLVQGDDQVNALKQAVQFGLDKRIHLAGAASRSSSRSRACRPRRASAPGCSNGIGSSPACRTSPNSSPPSRKKTGSVPTARTWFGFASTGPALSRRMVRSRSTAVKMAKFLGRLQASARGGAHAG